MKQFHHFPYLEKNNNKLWFLPTFPSICQQITEISTFQSNENYFPQLAHIFIITWSCTCCSCFCVTDSPKFGTSTTPNKFMWKPWRRHPLVTFPLMPHRLMGATKKPILLVVLVYHIAALFTNSDYSVRIVNMTYIGIVEWGMRCSRLK